MHLCQHPRSFLIAVSNKVLVAGQSNFEQLQRRHHLLGISCPLKTPSAAQTNGNLMEPSQDYTVDEAVHPTLVSVDAPGLKRRYEENRCLRGSKVNPAVFLNFSSLCTISSTLPTLIPVSCGSSRTVTRRLSRIISILKKK
jgi:hypothetical protein